MDLNLSTLFCVRPFSISSFSPVRLFFLKDQLSEEMHLLNKSSEP